MGQRLTGLPLRTLCWIIYLGFTFFGACSSVPHHVESVQHMSILVLPFKNFTATPKSGQTVSALFATSLSTHREGYLVSASPGVIKDVAGFTESGTLPSDVLATLAREHIDAVLFGNVTEYEYRSGLSTEPVVGFTWKLISTRTGRAVWMGAVSKVDSCFWVCRDTLSEFAKTLIDELVEKRESED